jgi:formyltetrahydrofolate deformylase
MSLHTRYYLTLSCKDVRGIVARVSGFIAAHDGFIIESAQFGDDSTCQFFLRMEFAAGSKTPDYASLCSAFAKEVGTPFSMHWYITNKTHKPRMVLMVSKHSHCLNDLLYRVETEQLRAEIPVVISNHPDLEHIAKRHHVPFVHLPMQEGGKAAQEQAVFELIEKHQADVVVLARYMQVLSDDLCSKLAGRAINIHHSFLPSFKGARPYEQAYNRGVKLIGATAHYVTADLDEGPIIEQEVARVDHSLSPDELTAIGRDTECLVLARALKYHLEHRVLLNGKKTVVFK